MSRFHAVVECPSRRQLRSKRDKQDSQRAGAGERCFSPFPHYRIVSITIFPSSFTSGDLDKPGFGAQSLPLLRVQPGGLGFLKKQLCMSGLQYDSDTLRVSDPHLLLSFSRVQHQLTFFQFLSPEACPISKSVQAVAALEIPILARCSSSSNIFIVRSIY